MARPSLLYAREFEDDPVAFMKKYSCAPADDVEGHTGEHTAYYSEKMSYRMMPPDKSIAYLSFEKVSKKHVHADEASGQIKIKGSFEPDVQLVRSYFLPWMSGAIVSMRIPEMRTGKEPKFFFTAALSGCSVFIKGTARTPMVFHAGGDTGVVGDPQGGAEFWQQLIEKDEASSTTTLGATVGEVNKTHYQVDKVKAFTGNKIYSLDRTSYYRPKMYNNLGTATSREFGAWLKKEVASDFLIEEVNTSGCVMGIRDDNGNWRFYLQENAMIFSHRFTKNFFGRKKKVENSKRVYARPMIVRQFFPGHSHVKISPMLSRKLRG